MDHQFSIFWWHVSVWGKCITVALPGVEGCGKAYVRHKLIVRQLTSTCTCKKIGIKIPKIQDFHNEACFAWAQIGLNLKFEFLIMLSSLWWKSLWDNSISSRMWAIIIDCWGEFLTNFCQNVARFNLIASHCLDFLSLTITSKWEEQRVHDIRPTYTSTLSVTYICM